MNGHISTVPAQTTSEPVRYDADGICHCTPRPPSSPIGECPRCHRLDPATVSQRVWDRLR